MEMYLTWVLQNVENDNACKCAYKNLIGYLKSPSSRIYRIDTTCYRLDACGGK